MSINYRFRHRDDANCIPAYDVSNRVFGIADCNTFPGAAQPKPAVPGSAGKEPGTVGPGSAGKEPATVADQVSDCEREAEYSAAFGKALKKVCEAKRILADNVVPARSQRASARFDSLNIVAFKHDHGCRNCEGPLCMCEA